MGLTPLRTGLFVLSFRAPEWIKAKELGAGLSVSPNKSFHYDLYSWLPTCDEKDKYFVFFVGWFVG